MSNLKDKYGSFKSITDNIENMKLNKEFWKKEQTNIDKRVEEGRKEKESMKMSFEKFHTPFTI